MLSPNSVTAITLAKTGSVPIRKLTRVGLDLRTAAFWTKKAPTVQQSDRNTTASQNDGAVGTGWPIPPVTSKATPATTPTTRVLEASQARGGEVPADHQPFRCHHHEGAQPGGRYHQEIATAEPRQAAAQHRHARAAQARRDHDATGGHRQACA